MAHDRRPDGGEKHAERERPPSRHKLPALDGSLGNQATLRVLRAIGAQAKLQVGAPGEPAEREADRVASHVVDRPSSPAPAVSRAAAPIEEPVEPPVERAQAKAAPGGAPNDDNGGDDTLSPLRGGGRPLPPEARADLASRMGD